MDSNTNVIKVFENHKFGQVRILLLENTPWFILVDVCKALEIGNPSQAMTRLDEDEKMTLTLNEGHSGQRGGAQMVNVVNEPGLYTLVLRSRKAEAKQFKRWITHEVLPTIRKHGAYMTDSVLEQVMKNPDTIYSLAAQLLEDKAKCEELSRQLKDAQPKAKYFDSFIRADGCICMFVVPNHLTLQWANEFLRLYPSAKLLVASKRDFETARRKKFCARIATGDYDAVIIGHSQFEKIPVSAERQERILNEQIDEIEGAIAEAKSRNGERFTIKQMEKTRKGLEVKLEKLKASDRKDDVITFEQLGVDRLFVDEAHAFKNRAKCCRTRQD